MQKVLIIFLGIMLLVSCREAEYFIQTDVLIVGGGASGTMAGIQAARLGVNSVIMEETPWLGGMLTAAGVSAVDGNYRLHSGLWNEFRQGIYDYYGGADSVKTGWVSNVLFEPRVGQDILTQMTEQEDKLTVYRNSRLIEIEKNGEGWHAVFIQKGKKIAVKARVTIDCTELGDVARQVGIPYDIGMDSRYESGEKIAPEKANNIIQDLTYVAILKDYGDTADVSFPKPKDYDPTPFIYTCAHRFKTDTSGQKLWDCDFMMKYGKLPNGYYMINWPIAGNDYYVNVIEMTPDERAAAYEKAKAFTLSYVYYLQTELGFKHLGIADDVYPTKDNLPFIPYHRESRRIKGLVRFTLNDISDPYSQKTALYRTGIAVGNYPVDHHHKAYPQHHLLPELHFYPVPSYNLPLGTLIPQQIDNFIVAEKSISVSNIVNGTTRLQPVCLLTGQAAGTLAALSVQNEEKPSEVSIRKVQKELINAGAYIMPYSDILPEHYAFKALQRIGATGILRGEGKNTGWENHTYIYPDSLVTGRALSMGLKEWSGNKKINLKDAELTFQEIKEVMFELADNLDINLNFSELVTICKQYNIKIPEDSDPVDRAFFAVLLDELLNPFEVRQIDHNGMFKDVITKKL